MGILSQSKDGTWDLGFNALHLTPYTLRVNLDFEFQNDTFNNGWTSYRTKKDRTLNLQATHTYQAPGKYKIFVKVIDIFGIDTSQIFEVEV